jgi:hypothetical protein
LWEPERVPPAFPPTNRGLLVRLTVIAVATAPIDLIVTRYAFGWPWPFAIWSGTTLAVGLVIIFYRQNRR